MKLQTVVTQTQDIELELPTFWKNPTEEKYLGIIDEKNCIKFSGNRDNSYKTISHLEYWLVSSDAIEAYTSWQIISEERFLEAHEKFIQSLSLQPKLVQVDPKDLKEVNI